MSLLERFFWVVAGLVAFSVGNVNAENYSEQHQEQLESLRQHLPHPTEFSQGAWRGTIEKDPITDRVLGRLHTTTQEDKTQYYQENKDVRLEVRCDHMSETVGVTTQKELSSDQVTISYRFDEQDHVTTQWHVGPDGDIYPEYGLDGEEPAEFVGQLTESEEMLFRVKNDDQLSLLSFSLKEFDSVYDEICGAFGDYREERERLMAEIQRERGGDKEGENRLSGGNENMGDNDTQEGQAPSVEDLTQRSRQRWQHAVENAWTRPPGSEHGLRVDVRVRLKPDGEVLSAEVTESSGSRAFDRSAENAVQRASPLWVPDGEELFWKAGFDDFVLRFDPDA